MVPGGINGWQKSRTTATTNIQSIYHLHICCIFNSQVLCKPKLMPIKSITLQKLEQLEEQLLVEKHPDTDQK